MGHNPGRYRLQTQASHTKTIPEQTTLHTVKPMSEGHSKPKKKEAMNGRKDYDLRTYYVTSKG